MKTPVRLLYISQYYPPEVGAGSVRAEVMVRVLSEMGFDVDVLSEIPNYPIGELYKGYHSQWKSIEESEHGTVTRLWVKINQRQTIWQQIVFFSSFMGSSLLHLISDTKQYDVIFVSSPPIFVSITAALMSKLKGAKFVLEVRDLWPDSAIKNNLFEQKSWFIRVGRALERWLYKTADLVVAVTDESARIIEQKSGKKNTAVVYNGVDTELFQPIPSSKIQIEEKKEKGKFRVGYVGSLGLIHDMQTVIEAAKLCESNPAIEFMIVGDGVKRNEMLSYMDSIQPNNVNWVGMKSHHEIPHYISSFDVALNPIHDTEAFKSIITVKFYEYLACEVPVISLAEGAQEKISDESGAGIICPIGDANVLADTIQSLFDNPNRLKKLKKNSRPFIEKTFSRRMQAQKLADHLMAVYSSSRNS